MERNSKICSHCSTPIDRDLDHWQGQPCGVHYLQEYELSDDRFHRCADGKQGVAIDKPTSQKKKK